MSIEEQKDVKKQKLDLIRFYHRGLIKDLGITQNDFGMKMTFYDAYGRKVIGVFDNEFQREKGFFIELVTPSWEPADPERKVYRIAPSDCFDEEYEKKVKNEKASYLVPVDELRPVDPEAVAISKSSAVTSSDQVFNTRNQQTQSAPVSKPAPSGNLVIEDAPYNDMTIRDYMAIHTGRPVSKKGWLNDLIKSSN